MFLFCYILTCPILIVARLNNSTKITILEYVVHKYKIRNHAKLIFNEQTQLASVRARKKFAVCHKSLGL